jgi:hypothetical protein
LARGPGTFIDCYEIVAVSGWSDLMSFHGRQGSLQETSRAREIITLVTK